jgi:hypothetical protein
MAKYLAEMSKSFKLSKMSMRVSYDRITTTIEREWLAEIIAGTKKIEYRQIKSYWTKRFAKVSMPFELRLLNGMNPPVPEVTVLSTGSRRTTMRANTNSTSRRFWRSSIGTSGGGGPSGKSRNAPQASGRQAFLRLP